MDENLVSGLRLLSSEDRTMPGRNEKRLLIVRYRERKAVMVMSEYTPVDETGRL